MASSLLYGVLFLILCCLKFWNNLMMISLMLYTAVLILSTQHTESRKLGGRGEQGVLTQSSFCLHLLYAGSSMKLTVSQIFK